MVHIEPGPHALWNYPKGQVINMKKIHAIRIGLALVSLAALAILLPVLGTVLLGLLALVLPMLLVVSPVLVLLSLVFLADRLRGKREPTTATGTEPVSIGAPALHSPAR
jgi:amino acid permease